MSFPLLPAPTPENPMLSRWQLLRAADDRPIARVTLADGFFSRLRGLMLRPPLAAGEGLLLVPCRSLHTCFVRSPLALIFLDSDGRIVGLREHLPPFRTASGGRSCRAVVELPAEHRPLAGLEPGQRLCLRGDRPLPRSVDFLA